MKHDDFPSLYLAADSAAIETQSTLLRFHKYNNILLIAGAAAAAVSIESRAWAIVGALLFLASLALYVYGQVFDLQAKWYKSRALAESVKTASWRFVMSAEPFAGSTQDSRGIFQRLLSELLHENHGIAAELSHERTQGSAITDVMATLRESSLESKKAFYQEERIEEQQSWYARKARENKKASRNWFTGLCFLYGLVILCLLIRIAIPGAGYLPVDVFAVAAGCAIGWMQLKRFAELASAYGLTANEISIIKISFDETSDAQSLSRFVSDAENAFSREHTQWAARRDHAK